MNVTDQPRISYGLDQSAPSKIRFLRFKPSSCNLYGAERIFSNCHGAERSGYPLIEISRILAERIIRTNLLSRIRTDFPRMSRSGSEQISARGKSHGLSRSRYPPLRNVTDRCGLGNAIRNNPDYGLYFNPYTSLLVFPWKPRKKRLASLARLMITILHKSQSNRVDCTGLTICGHKLYWGKDCLLYTSDAADE